MRTKDIKILAIETSCDETAAAVISNCHAELVSASRGSRNKFGMTECGRPVILSNIVSSQIDLHAKTGGVVPEVASRAHMEAMIPVIQEALEVGCRACGVGGNSSQPPTPNTPLLTDITHIAVTAGPGLIGSLLVGFNTAKAIAYALDVPIIPINHIEGHIYSAFGGEFPISNFQFPILALTVSGGHTSLTLMRDHGVYETIGQTRDDAAGEAFDKVAKLLDLGYPGGPAVSKLAEQFRNSRESGVGRMEKGNQNTPPPTPDPSPLVLPRPMIKEKNFDFSFSGLKTAVLDVVNDLSKNHKLKTKNWQPAVAAAFEDAAVDVLVTKTLRAAEKYQPKAVILAGGVAANKRLREELERRLLQITNHKKQITNLACRTSASSVESQAGKIQNPKSKSSGACNLQPNSYNLILPPAELCGDNAAMIGLAAYYHIVRGDTKNWDQIKIDSNLKI